MKSRYSISAPKIDFFVISDWLSPAIYINLIFCVSHAVRPAKINTPATEITKSSCVDARKIFTTDAMIRPISPTTMKDPIADRLRFVV
ncbi:MAG: Uncharacterised protein [SAR116 cluster bacterium]|nr:MAG: Uncharacterised protein [SAR116 cluster bacterium]